MHVSRGSKHILNIYKYNKTGSILKIEPFFMFFHRTFVRFEIVIFYFEFFMRQNDLYKYEDTYLAFAKSRTFTFQK